MNAGRHKRMILFLLAGSAAVILAAAFSVLYGSTGIPANQVFGAIVYPDMENRQHIIIRELRIPRTLGCMLVGAAFSSAGAIMQGVTRNPLADSGPFGDQCRRILCSGALSCFSAGLWIYGSGMLFLSGCSVSHGDGIWSDESETAENRSGQVGTGRQRREYLPFFPQSGGIYFLSYRL